MWGPHQRDHIMRYALFVSAASLTVMLSTAVSAQQSSAQNCKPELITATGSAGFTERGARNNAIANWRRDAIARYGEFWADFEQARDADVSRCAHTGLKLLLRCEARGRPCLVSAENSSPVSVLNPATCNKSDSKNCNPYIKAMQIKLTQKGCRTQADGAGGSNTSTALKCFQRKANLPVTGDVDVATVNALNG